MSTGENIQYLRKRDGYTQESFAEQMGVSRQTISKWESDSCFPEMEKLLLMCDMFRCKLDDLVRGDVQAEAAKDTAGYDAHMNHFAKRITAGVVLVLLGVCAMLIAYGIHLPEAIAALPLFPFLIAALAFFITGGMKHDHFVKKHPEIIPFYTEEEQETFHKKFISAIAIGISLILVGVAFMIGGAAVFGEEALDANEHLASLVTAVMLLFITAGTAVLVYMGMQDSKYKIQEYNQENKIEKSRAGKISDGICGCIMLLSTIIFLLWSFLTNRWDISWLVFPIGGMLCAVVSIVCRLVCKEESAQNEE